MWVNNRVEQNPKVFLILHLWTDVMQYAFKIGRLEPISATAMVHLSCLYSIVMLTVCQRQYIYSVSRKSTVRFR